MNKREREYNEFRVREERGWVVYDEMGGWMSRQEDRPVNRSAIRQRDDHERIDANRMGRRKADILTRATNI